MFLYLESLFIQNMVHSLHFVVIDEICYYYFRIFLIICNRQTGSKNALRTQLNAFNAVCVSGVTFYSWGVATVFISSASWLKYKWQKHWIWIYQITIWIQNIVFKLIKYVTYSVRFLFRLYKIDIKVISMFKPVHLTICKLRITLVTIYVIDIIQEKICCARVN